MRSIRSSRTAGRHQIPALLGLVALVSFAGCDARFVGVLREAKAKSSPPIDPLTTNATADGARAIEARRGGPVEFVAT